MLSRNFVSLTDSPTWTGQHTFAFNDTTYFGNGAISPILAAVAPPVSGAGMNFIIEASNAVGSGAGGKIILKPGAKVTSGANGCVVILAPGGIIGTNDLEISVNNSVATMTVSPNAFSGQTLNIVCGSLTYQFTDTTFTLPAGAVVNTTSSVPLIVRQSGGTPGTDDLAIYEDGTKAVFKSFNSQFSFIDSGNNVRLSYGGDAWTVGSSTNLVVASGYIVSKGVGLYIQDSKSIFFDTGSGSSSGLKSAASKVIKVTDGATGGGTLSSPPLSPAQITGDQNNYAPGVARSYRLSTDASHNITGLSVGQVDGQECEIWNVGTQNIVLVNESGSSTAANRFLTTTGTDITLAPNQRAYLKWFSAEQSNTGRWRVGS